MTGLIYGPISNLVAQEILLKELCIGTKRIIAWRSFPTRLWIDYSVLRSLISSSPSLSTYLSVYPQSIQTYTTCLSATDCFLIRPILFRTKKSNFVIGSPRCSLEEQSGAGVPVQISVPAHFGHSPDCFKSNSLPSWNTPFTCSDLTYSNHLYWTLLIARFCEESIPVTAKSNLFSF